MTTNFPSSYNIKYYFWTTFKTVIIQKGLSVQYDDDIDDSGLPIYTIYAYNDPKIHVCTIYKTTVPNGVIPSYSQAQNDSDKSDFETNYKTGANQTTSTASADNQSNSNIKSPVLPARANTSAPTWTDGYQVPLSVDTTGALRITGSISASNPSVSTNNSAIPSSSTQVGGSDGTNLQPVRVFDLDSGGGVQYVLGVGLRKAASGGSVELGTSSDPIRIDPIGTTTQPVSGTVTANAGTGSFLVANASPSNLNAQVFGGASSGASPNGNPVRIAGTDGTLVRDILTDTTGRVAITGSITANAGTGNFTVVQATASNLNATVIGTGTDNTNIVAGKIPVLSGRANTSAPTWGDGNMVPLSVDTSGNLRTTNLSIGTNSATVPGFSTVVGGKDTSSSNTIPLKVDSNGALFVTNLSTVSMKATTASEAAIGTAVPGVLSIASMVGGSVTTSAPSYTNGQMSPLSLDTTGALRITGSISATNPSVVTYGSVFAGYVTVEGTYASSTPITLTDGYVGFLSQNSTGGGLRVEGSKRNTEPWDINSGVMVIGARSTDNPQTWSNDGIAGLTVNTLGGGLRVDGTRNTNANYNALHGGMPSMARANTSAQTYSNDTWAPLSVDTGGALRVNSSPSDTTASGTLNALNAAATISLSGQSGVGMQLAAGTLIGTIVPEVSFDGGTTWVATLFDDPTTGNKVSSIVFGSSNTATSRSIISASGSSHARVRVSAFTSGTASCGIRASQAGDPSSVSSGPAAGTLPLVITQIGGSVTTAAPTYTTATLNALSLTTAGGVRIDGVFTQGSTTSGQSGSLMQGAVTTAQPAYTTAQTSPLSMSVNGGLRTESLPTTKQCYSGAARNITPPATPTDIVIINGSASKTIRVLRIIMSATQTTAGINEFLFVKRSTANTGGTSSTPTPLPMDSNNAAVTAVVRQYSVNPTGLGTTVANLQAIKLLTPQSTSTTQPQYVIDFTSGLSQGVVLRGTAEGLALNFNGAALPTGLNVACTFEWTEE